MTPTVKRILDETLADLRRVGLPLRPVDISQILASTAVRFGPQTIEEINRYLDSKQLPRVS